MVVAGRPRALAALVSTLALAVCCEALAADLAKGAVVRVEASGIESGWHQGRIGIAPSGCTMVYLDTQARGGYTMVSLQGASRMQRKDGSQWVDVPVKALASQQPKACQGDND